ncbi:MAG TPA: large conductance mechanosensitive channel protein MscL [Patescibacteria group bacterium]|jgi:large conductance mechanosensitive channel|nr:large conductance mechanosensitive channel protein MscL [Patescibacteria group bacterium]
MIGEFKKFLLETNAFALAIGVIIGAAVGKVVSSMVSDLLMPLVGMLIPGGAWRTWQIVLSTDAEGKVANALNTGAFLGAVVDFVIIGFIVFMITKTIMKPAPAPAPAPTKICPQCVESVPAAARKCRYCASPV